jgi:hypothetical protein
MIADSIVAALDPKSDEDLLMLLFFTDADVITEASQLRPLGSLY